MTDSQILGPRIRILRAVEIGRHPQVRQQLVNKAPEVLEALQVAAIDLNRCGEVKPASEAEPFVTVCVAPVEDYGHEHFGQYEAQEIALPDGASGRGLL